VDRSTTAVNSPVLVFSQYPPKLNHQRIVHSSTRGIGKIGFVMVSSSQIREKLADFLERRIDLNDFEDWFIQSTWNVHQSGSLAAENLTFAVEESLSEYSSSHINDTELRQEFANLIQRDNVIVHVAKAAQIVVKFSFPVLRGAVFARP
jgi:hypothetical protein